MHTFWVRLNAVVFFGFTVLLCLSLLAATSTYLHKPEVSKGWVQRLEVKQPLLQLRRIRDRGTQGYNYDQALFTFDLDADLAPAFNWNIKQLFVFLVAEYKSKKNVLSQVVVWDKIIEKREDAKLKLRGEFMDYPLRDPALELRNNTVTLKLYWDHMPLTGSLFMRDEGAYKLELPGEWL